MGTSLSARYCTSCGGSLAPEHRFCARCGESVAAALASLAEEHASAVQATTGDGGTGSAPVELPGSEAPSVDLFRYHDLTKRLGVFSTDGGSHLRGDAEDLQISEAEPSYRAGEGELARIAGATELIGPRSIPGIDSTPSLGLVASGAGMLVLTNQRLIVMFQEPGTTQFGQLDGSAVHTFVLPWDLVDTISMPSRKTLKDRVAGGRMITIYALLIGTVLRIMPIAREFEKGQTGKLKEEDALALLAHAAAANRILVSPPTHHPRLRAILAGSFSSADGEVLAHITDEETNGVPAHLVERLVEHEATNR